MQDIKTQNELLRRLVEKLEELVAQFATTEDPETVTQTKAEAHDETKK